MKKIIFLLGIIPLLFYQSTFAETLWQKHVKLYQTTSSNLTIIQNIQQKITLGKKFLS